MEIDRNELELFKFVVKDLDGQPGIGLFDGKFYKVLPLDLADTLISLTRKILLELEAKKGKKKNSNTIMEINDGNKK